MRFSIPFWAFIGFATAAAARAETVSCSAHNYDERAVVRAVIDGDTVRLADGRHVRLIGINAPELGHDGAAAEAYATQATREVEQRLGGAAAVWLVHDSESRDRYGRTLAHIFLPDGTNLQAALLRAGAAQILTLPPDLAFLDCYRESELEARRARRGLWALADYYPRATATLGTEDTGFRSVSGRLTGVRHRHGALWLELDKRFPIRIDSNDLRYFRGVKFEQWLGRTLVARGYVTSRRGRLRMHVRHPASIESNDQELRGSKT